MTLGPSPPLIVRRRGSLHLHTPYDTMAIASYVSMVNIRKKSSIIFLSLSVLSLLTGLLVFVWGSGFLRIYGGDAIAIIFLYSFLGVTTPLEAVKKGTLVFFFGFFLELLQVILHGDAVIFELMLGQTFDPIDILIYLFTCLLLVLIEDAAIKYPLHILTKAKAHLISIATIILFFSIAITPAVMTVSSYVQERLESGPVPEYEQEPQRDGLNTYNCPAGIQRHAQNCTFEEWVTLMIFDSIIGSVFIFYIITSERYLFLPAFFLIITLYAFHIMVLQAFSTATIKSFLLRSASLGAATILLLLTDSILLSNLVTNCSAEWLTLFNRFV